MTEKKRCSWCNPKNKTYIRYHDEEWGVPDFGERHLFEMLILESFQAGLSWECVLNKREAFRKAYDGFDLEKVCAYDEKKMAELAEDASIIRNRLKIRASVENARIFKKISEEYGSFYEYLKVFTGGKLFAETGQNAFAAVGCGQQRSEKTRDAVCGNDDHLFVSAGGRRDRFPRGGMLFA